MLARVAVQVVLMSCKTTKVPDFRVCFIGGCEAGQGRLLHITTVGIRIRAVARSCRLRLRAPRPIDMWPFGLTMASAPAQASGWTWRARCRGHGISIAGTCAARGSEGASYPLAVPRGEQKHIQDGPCCNCNIANHSPI